MVSLGFKHIYYGNDKGTLAIALGIVLRLSAHNFKSLIIMPQDLSLQKFICNHIKNISVLFYDNIDFTQIESQFFAKYDAIFFLSLRPENLNVVLLMSGQLKGKEIIITTRKFDSKLKGKFDYITDVKRYSSLNSNRVVIITGDGKGKTTGALGMALIERMKGKKAYIFHFLKNKMGLTEDKALLNLDGFESIRLGRDEPDYTWITRKGPDKKDVELVREGLQLVSERIKLFQNSLIVLDEILFAVSKRLVDEKDVIKLIREKSPQTILLLTGRGENNNIFQNANKIFIMEKIKHPYDDKVPARKGIEY